MRSGIEAALGALGVRALLDYPAIAQERGEAAAKGLLRSMILHDEASGTPADGNR